MGRLVDRLFLIVLGASALYILFLAALDSVAAAGLLAFICSAVLMHRFHRPHRRRMSAADAREILERWACGDDAEAERAIAGMLRAEQGGASLRYISRHPSAALSAGDVFGAWKSARGETRLILAVPCYADVRARALARTLAQPSVEIADASKLLPLIRRTQPAPDRRRPTRVFARIRALLRALPERRAWWKNALFGALLIPVYLLTGNLAYLVLGAALLFLAGAGWRLRHA